MLRPLVVRIVIGWILASGIVAGPHRGWAHEGPGPAIDFWGAFAPDTARCQRVLSSALQRCFTRVFAVEQWCMDGQLAGAPCAETSKAGRIAVARQLAQQEVEATCTDIELQQLRFGGLDEVKTDVARACDEQVAAALSVAYGPAVARGSTAADAPTRACLQQTAMLGARLIRYAARLNGQALDRIASVPGLTADQKHALLARAAERITGLRARIERLLASLCPSFDAVYGRSVGAVLDRLGPRGECLIGAGYVQSALTCPVAQCGNGVTEAGEQCDDGNAVDDDLCHTNCTNNPCTVFPSTFALIQSALFERHGCTNAACHGSADAPQGGLDLRPATAYRNLLDVASTADPRLHRVEPGDQDRSLLWLKLAAATLGRSGVPGAPMPLGTAPLSEQELEALRLWIHAAAPDAGTVAGVAELLDACALPPDPIAIKPLDPPAPGDGVQLHMPRWELPPHSESEVCFATYYDFTDRVPPAFRGGDGTTFRYRRQELAQDPQSHHLIVNLYRGETGINDPVWGAFACKGGPRHGDACDPLIPDACGAGGACGSAPGRSVACIGWGPPDLQTNPGNGGFTGTQETAGESRYPDGVFAELPLKGIIVWNSHAFNVTDRPAKQEGWINFYFAPPAEQRYPVHGIFDARDIFVPNVPPFESREYCSTHELPQGAQLFELSSHTHKRGKRFTIFAPDGTLLFTNYVYNDPLQLRFDAPLAFPDADPATRTLRYCGLFDNGASDPTEVKRKSTSPPTPNGFPFGGPCSIPSGCVEGRVGERCSGSTQAKRNAACDTTPGAGDGFCDACTLRGGVTTEDEMFILLGSYFVK